MFLALGATNERRGTHGETREHLLRNIFSERNRQIERERERGRERARGMSSSDAGDARGNDGNDAKYEKLSKYDNYKKIGDPPPTVSRLSDSSEVRRNERSTQSSSRYRHVGARTIDFDYFTSLFARVVYRSTQCSYFIP